MKIARRVVRNRRLSLCTSPAVDKLLDPDPVSKKDMTTCTSDYFYRGDSGGPRMVRILVSSVGLATLKRVKISGVESYINTTTFTKSSCQSWRKLYRA